MAAPLRHALATTNKVLFLTEITFNISKGFFLEKKMKKIRKEKKREGGERKRKSVSNK